MSLFAAKPFKVTKGSLEVLKQETTATWSIDLSEAVFVNNGIFAKENKGDFKTWCEEDYDERVSLMNEAFFDAFNVYSTGMGLVTAKLQTLSDTSKPCRSKMSLKNFTLATAESVL